MKRKTPSNNVPLLDLPAHRLGVGVRQEAHARARVQVQQRLELLPDAHLRRLVRRRARPDADLVLLGPDVDDDAADLVALGKLLADGGEERVEPHGVERGLGVLAPGDEDGPLAAVLARGVLPLFFFYYYYFWKRLRK